MNTSDIAFVVCYFNPLNYLSKYLNFLLFYDKIQTYSGIKIIFVESYTRKCKLRINKNVGDVMSFKNESFFWKKRKPSKYWYQKTNERIQICRLVRFGYYISRR